MPLGLLPESWGVFALDSGFFSLLETVDGILAFAQYGQAKMAADALSHGAQEHVVYVVMPIYYSVNGTQPDIGG
jgi:hypothetical protein